MTRYIAILRGINVGGNRKILMADLRSLLEKHGLSHVTTYIQSGNVAFNAKTQPTNKELERQITHAIKDKYGFDVPVLARSSDEMNFTLSANPFAQETDIDPKKLHVTFLENLPEKEKIQELSKLDFPPDRFEVIGQNVFVHCPDKYGETKLSNSFFEKKLGVAATTRNWRTVNKLADMAAETY